MQNIQKYLGCHDYHMGSCKKTKAECQYSHIGQSWGICPNKNFCPTPHQFVDCPLDNQCVLGLDCSYRHKNRPATSSKSASQQSIFQVKSNDCEFERDFKKLFKQTNKDLKTIFQYVSRRDASQSQTMGGVSADLAFIVDITGSMSNMKNQVFEFMKSTVQQIYEDFPTLKLRVAFSGFRDYNNGKDRQVNLEFTDDLKHFTNSLNSIQCSGGGIDLTEDVAGGLYNALQFDWEGKARQAFYVSDYPGHGNRYNQGVLDQFPNGDPDGRVIEDLMKQFKCKDIQFTCIKITEYTDKMFSIMRQSYGNDLNISPISAPVQFQSVAAKQLNKTVSTSVSKSSAGDGAAAAAASDPFVNMFKAGYAMVQQLKRVSMSHLNSGSKSQFKTTGNEDDDRVLMRKVHIEEEEEFDSDDSDYESKISSVSSKQKVIDQETKTYNDRITKEKRIAELKKQFPSHYFEDDSYSISSQSQYANNKKSKMPKVEYLANGVIDWALFPKYSEYQAVCHSYELIVSKNSNQIDWQNLRIATHHLGTKVRICDLVLAEGGMRYAFPAKDLYLNHRMIAKQYKKPERQIKMGLMDMQRDIHSQIVCQHIVKEFNRKMVRLYGAEAKLLQFIDSFIYEMIYPITKNKYYFLENYIEGEYEKFNNNAGYTSDSVNPYNPVAQALSHFSWQYSKGYLIIVDLQGNEKGILTDPQIHSWDQEQFGEGNLGYEGMLKFFVSHTCNEYCESMNLINPTETGTLPLGFLFERSDKLMKRKLDLKELEEGEYDENGEEEEEKETSSSEKENEEIKLMLLCDVCRQPHYFDMSHHHHKKSHDETEVEEEKLEEHKTESVEQQEKAMVCKSCTEQIEKTKFTVNCVVCSKELVGSTFSCKMLRRDFQRICEPCKFIES